MSHMKQRRSNCGIILGSCLETLSNGTSLKRGYNTNCKGLSAVPTIVKTLNLSIDWVFKSQNFNWLLKTMREVFGSLRIILK
ncbi:unnamed protein product [Allacma fusca]|uniref:Uncharacterized protein n=1 Tax=Allacma fusca TaxID=39272 RepID=A0A8J2KLH9_9HEXA|nr:unnamed protein product [Allacma fusca]